MDKAAVKKLQRELNDFSNEHLKHVTPLRVDGDKGFATERRILRVKYYLGYPEEKRDDQKDLHLDEAFYLRLHHPNRTQSKDHPKWPANHEAVDRGQKRRLEQRRAVEKSFHDAKSKNGVGSFDGKPVAKAVLCHLHWARDHGWDGTLTSGWRDPDDSEHLCYSICGYPMCPGRCAGKSSNHVGATPLRFAVDVTDYVTFGRLMHGCPCTPRIFNALGAQDPVHFSPSGR